MFRLFFLSVFITIASCTSLNTNNPKTQHNNTLTQTRKDSARITSLKLENEVRSPNAIKTHKEFQVIHKKIIQPIPQDIDFGNNSFASFKIDTLHSDFEYALEKNLDVHWVIKNDTLRLGIDSILVKIDNKLDTILFYASQSNKADTIICNISVPTSYKFSYRNGVFWVNENKFGMKLIARVIFLFTDKVEQSLFLGNLGQTGVLLTTKVTNVISPQCRSKNLPNIITIGLRQIKECHDEDDCEYLMCFDNGENEIYGNYYYKTISDKLNIKYMPLSVDPIFIKYDPIKDKVIIKTE